MLKTLCVEFCACMMSGIHKHSAEKHKFRWTAYSMQALVIDVYTSVDTKKQQKHFCEHCIVGKKIVIKFITIYINILI